MFFDKTVNLFELRKQADEELTDKAKDKNQNSLKQALASNPKNLIGSVLANCKIGKILGIGGSGVVYKAHHKEQGSLVIKVLQPKHKFTSEESQRFLKEINVLSRLEHENLIRILSAGIEQELFFILMNYIEGMTLEKLLENEQKFSPQRACQIILGASHAIKAVHSANIIHRDIKPSNILVSSKKQQVVLLDFGLVKDQQMPCDITQRGVAVGTPTYMAPEQCCGREVDFRTDIYSLGATFFHLLVGKPPFLGFNAVATMLAQASKPLELPHSIDPSIPENISLIVARMMEKEPIKRYQNMDELIVDLEKLIQASNSHQGEPLA